MSIVPLCVSPSDGITFTLLHSIHPSIAPWALRSYLSNVPSLPHYRWVSRLFGLALVSWALLLVYVAFPFAFHISVFFHSLFFTCHWISFVCFSLWGYFHPTTNSPPLPGLGTGTGSQLTLRRSYIIKLNYYIYVIYPTSLGLSLRHLPENLAYSGLCGGVWSTGILPATCPIWVICQ